VKDYTSPVPFNPGGCPDSTLTKSQADETTQNTADNTTETTEGGTQDNTDDAALTYTADTQASPLAVNPSDELVYKLHYHNAGGGGATGVTVTDSIPAGTAFVAGSCSQTCVTTGTPVTSVSFSLGSEAAGATADVYFEVTVNSTNATSATVTINNFGHVAATGETGSDSNHVYASLTYSPTSGLTKSEADVQSNTQVCNTATVGTATSTSACIQVPGTLIAIGDATYVSGPITVSPGDIVAYKLHYSNSGDSGATNVVVTDSIPAGSTYVASSCTNSCVPSPASGTVTSLAWPGVSVAAGGSFDRYFEVKLNSAFPAWDGKTPVAAPAADQVLNTGGVTSTDEATNIPSNQVEADVVAAGSPGLIKTAGAPFTNATNAACPIGKTCVTYTISYFNTGSGSLSSQTLSDSLPAGVTFVACTGGCSGTTTVTWTVDIPGGTSAANPAGSVTVTVDY
jgi:uncharacterized repeat protein (TIGR01451 family)